MTQSFALSIPLHLEPIPRHDPSTNMVFTSIRSSTPSSAYDSMHIRKRMDRTTPNGSKRNSKSKKLGMARSPPRPSHPPNISSKNKPHNNLNVIHSKSTDTAASTRDSSPHKTAKKKADPPVVAAADSNNHTNVEPTLPTPPTSPPIREPPTDPKIIVLAIVGSLGGLACCFCCLLGASKIGCCFLHRFAIGKKNNDVVFETVSVGGKKIGPPMPIEDTDGEGTGGMSTPTTMTSGPKLGMAHFTEFWNVPETSKDGKRSSRGHKSKAGQGSLGSGAKATTPTAHHITSPIESIPPQRFARADSPTIYYNPEFAFGNRNGEIQLGVALPQSPLPAAVVAQTTTDPFKSKRMPPGSSQPLSKTSESYISIHSQPSSVSVFWLNDHSDTPQQQQHQKRSGPKPHPINTSSWLDSSTSSIHKSPTTPFPGSQTRAGGDEGYFSAHPPPSSVQPSPVYPPYPTGSAYHVTHQQQPVGFDQAQHQHRIQTPYQGQHRSEYESQERYYY